MYRRHALTPADFQPALHPCDRFSKRHALCTVRTCEQNIHAHNTHTSRACVTVCSCKVQALGGLGKMMVSGGMMIPARMPQPAHTNSTHEHVECHGWVECTVLAERRGSPASDELLRDPNGWVAGREREREWDVGIIARVRCNNVMARGLNVSRATCPVFILMCILYLYFCAALVISLRTKLHLCLCVCVCGYLCTEFVYVHACVLLRTGQWKCQCKAVSYLLYVKGITQ